MIKKYSLVRIKRQCCFYLPFHRNNRLNLYLLIVFFGLIVLLGSHKRSSSIEDSNELPEKSALGIACKVFPGLRGCAPVDNSEYGLSKEEIAVSLDEINTVDYKLFTEPSIKTVAFAPIANYINLKHRPEIKRITDNGIIIKHNKPGNSMILNKNTGVNGIIQDTENSKTSISESKKKNELVFLKKLVGAGIFSETQPKINDLQNIYNTLQPITTDYSTQIRRPILKNIITKPMLLNNDTIKISVRSKTHNVSQTEYFSNTTVEEIRQKVLKINNIYTVYNSDKFGPLTEGSVIILIQVHKRLDNLRELINSLERVRGINSSLLVFSHDYYSEDIINLVMEIKFAKFLVIFFPYSVQIHPNDFPGKSPDDCPWNASNKSAEKLKCNMYQHPDLYGHYRQGHMTQIKHHWWWKANKVFDVLEYTKHHKGMFLFLEDDLYVTEDLLHVVNLMQKMKNEVCTKCDMFFLGSQSADHPFIDWIPNEVEVGSWNSIGFAFNRVLWDRLKNCSKTFCTFDDYNWDWSMRYTIQECFENVLSVLSVKGARVIHNGKCEGVHHKVGCTIENSMREINNQIKGIQDRLFPSKLEFDNNPYETDEVEPITKGWGGWGDPRDQTLCMNMTKHTVKL